MRHVVVIGGGASGLVAAISAARNGAKVTIIEHKDRVGKKILSTGNGRCNLTNTYMNPACFRSDDVSLVTDVLEKFGAENTIRFFEDLGVILKDRNGYVYPFSDQASTILDVLRLELDNLKIDIKTEQNVKSVVKTNHQFEITTDKENYMCDAVILATGGKASSVLGSDGSGYDLAKHFGHNISPVVPALVQLKCAGDFFKQITGVRTQAKVSLYVNNVLVSSDTGELQLTNYGISGIPVFQVSRYAAKALYSKESVCAELDFLPNIEIYEFETFMKNRIQKHGQKTAEDFMTGVLHKKLTTMLLKEAKIPLHVVMNEVYEEKINQLIRLCKCFKVNVLDTNGFEQAQVCAGGVKTTEIRKTMESIYEENLYLVGELLDVDGICGGYNLQWAWATGFIAGENAAKGK